VGKIAAKNDSFSLERLVAMWHAVFLRFCCKHECPHHSFLFFVPDSTICMHVSLHVCFIICLNAAASASMINANTPRCLFVWVCELHRVLNLPHPLHSGTIFHFQTAGFCHCYLKKLKAWQRNTRHTARRNKNLIGAFDVEGYSPCILFLQPMPLLNLSFYQCFGKTNLTFSQSITLSCWQKKLQSNKPAFPTIITLSWTICLYWTL